MKYIWRVGYLFILIVIIVCCYCNAYVIALDQVCTEMSEVMQWEVGQFVEYQVITLENECEHNRYMISLVGKEEIDGTVYFWEKIDIYQYIYFMRGEKLRKNVTFLALVLPLTREEFKNNPSQYISNGFFPGNARRLKVRILGEPFVEVDPKAFFSHQDILEDTPYSMTSHAMGTIDFSRMHINPNEKKISVPAGTFVCDHFFVKTDINREYWDEEFHLWRSSEIPLLGIVKMYFSSTHYWEKWAHKNENEHIESINDLIRQLFRKRIPGRRRPDTHVVNLIKYGQNDEYKKK